MGKLAKLMTTAEGTLKWFWPTHDEAAVVRRSKGISREFDGSKAGDRLSFRTERHESYLKPQKELLDSCTLKLLLDAHMPIQEAIKKTRALLEDFQRHGSNKNMRYAYAFFNSSIQGRCVKKLTDELRNGNPRARNLAP